MGLSLGTRIRHSAPYLAQFVGLGLGVLTITMTTGGWPNSGPWAWASWALFVLAAFYMVLALWEFFRPPNESKITFSFPRKSGTLHDIRWLDIALGWIGLNRQRRNERVQTHIGNYMSLLLNDCSKARMLTRDLSWAESADSELTRLAESGALVLVCCDHGPQVPVSPSIAKYQSQGAIVKKTKLKSSIRMTMIENSGSSLVAIGYRDGRKHIISHVRDQHDPVFQMAKTLLDSLG